MIKKIINYILNYLVFNKINYNKVQPETLFHPKLQLYMNGSDLFHAKVFPIIKYLGIAKLDFFIFTSLYNFFPNFFFTQWLIKHRSTGFLKIVNSANGDILCIRNFLWVFGVLIWEESVYSGYNGVTNDVITEKYLLLIRDMGLRYQNVYLKGSITPVSVAFEIDGLLPDNKEDYLDLTKWLFDSSTRVVYLERKK